MIVAKNISHYYGSDRALENVNLEIKKGEFVAIIGESGSGKSTLLSILSTLLTPSAGELIFDGVVYGDIKNIDKFRKENIGFIFQFHYLIEYLTLTQNIRVANPQASLDEILALLKILDIEQFANKLPNELSGGQRQRAAIARALINKPKVIFADEPTGNLDSKNAKKVFALFRELSKNETTIIVTTHNRDLANEADRVVEVKDGEL